MKSACFIFSVALFLSACNNTNKKVKERILNSDSIAINYFKGDGSMDTVVAISIIRDKIKINKLITFIAEHSVEVNYKCGYDGSLHFFKMNQVIQDIDFNMNDAGCMYFSFLQDGKPVATTLSKKAKDLITSFRKK